jgi:hypothetical protein
VPNVPPKATFVPPVTVGTPTGALPCGTLVTGLFLGSSFDAGATLVGAGLDGRLLCEEAGGVTETGEETGRTASAMGGSLSLPGDTAGTVT